MKKQAKHHNQELSLFKEVTMKKAIRIVGTISALLLLIFSSMPGVQAVSSLSPGVGGQEALPQAGEPEAKISALLSLQVGARLRCQQAPPTAGELSMMEARGMNIANLDIQRIFIYLAEEPHAAAPCVCVVASSVSACVLNTVDPLSAASSA